MRLSSSYSGLGVYALSEVVLKAVPLDVLDRFLARAFRVPVVCFMFHSSVVAMSNKYSLNKYRYLDP